MKKINKITTLKRAIKFLRSEDADYCVLLCHIDLDIDVPKGFDEDAWVELIHSYKTIAEEKFAGEYWKGVGLWWNLSKAYREGKITEVYELKAQFLEYILLDILNKS